MATHGGGRLANDKGPDPPALHYNLSLVPTILKYSLSVLLQNDNKWGVNSSRLPLATKHVHHQSIHGVLGLEGN